MSRSSASSCRTSPTMIRSGRIRSASLTSRRSRISPVPSRLGCRVCIATDVRAAAIRSSKTSSQVMTRSRGGIALARQLSIVVLPACVPPATTMLSPAATAASRNRAACAGSVPRLDELVEGMGRDDELPDVHAQCSRVMSGITTCSRDPSGEHRVHEGARQVDPTAGGLQHPLDEVPDLARGEDRRGQLAPAATGDEHPAGLVQPDLLDLGIVEVGLQRPEPGDRVVDLRGPPAAGRPAAAASWSATARRSRR